MKSKFDLKHSTAKIKPENPDDLHLLSSLITAGSKAKARTMRSIEVERGEKKEKVGKKPMVLKITVEKIELKENLRISGKIIEGPEDITRGYHTLEIKPNTQLTIEKDWKNWEIEKIKSAQIKAEPVLVCILDERECDFYLIKERARHISRITSKGLQKAQGTPDKEYFGKITAEIKRNQDSSNYLVIGGPGFSRETLVKQLKTEDLTQRIISEPCSHTEMLGLQEILRRKILEKVIKHSRITEETEIIEKFLEELAKEGKAVYGKKETLEALEVGAVETLLISDKKARESEGLMEKAERIKARIMIISSEHESGEKFLGLGGIGALLRYKIDY